MLQHCAKLQCQKNLLQIYSAQPIFKYLFIVEFRDEGTKWSRSLFDFFGYRCNFAPSLSSFPSFGNRGGESWRLNCSRAILKRKTSLSLSLFFLALKGWVGSHRSEMNRVDADFSLLHNSTKPILPVGSRENSGETAK